MTMGTPPSSQAYGEPWYWDNRYAHESAPFDWYQKYPALAPLIHLYVPHRHQRVLVVGCGNSVFSEEMVNDGYEDVVNVDISSVVIDAMQAKCSNRPQLKYIKLDVRDMSPFQGGSFDAVIDKGTLDSILCGNNSRRNAAQMLDEVWRVLKDKGVYILVTLLAFYSLFALNLSVLACVGMDLELYEFPTLGFHSTRVCAQLFSASLTVLASAADYVWRSGISPRLAERILHLEHKTACDRLIEFPIPVKFGAEGSSEQPVRQLTDPIPLDESGSSVEDVLGKNPDVHYIYVCTKEPKANE